MDSEAKGIATEVAGSYVEALVAAGGRVDLAKVKIKPYQEDAAGAPRSLARPDKITTRSASMRSASASTRAPWSEVSSPKTPKTPKMPNKSHRRYSAPVMEDDSDYVADNLPGNNRVLVPNLPRFDTLTLQTWFNSIDSNHSGDISKTEWFTFMRTNRQLKMLILGDTVETDSRADAKEMRKLLDIWKSIDTDGNGTLDFDEFVEFFRKSNMLLEYASKDNPRDRIASIVDNVNGNVALQGSELDEFQQLASKHLQHERRQSMRVEMVSTIRRRSSIDAEAVLQLPSLVANDQGASHRRYSSQV